MPVSIRELYASIGALKQPLSKMRRTFVDDLKDLQYRPLSMMTEQDIHRGHYIDDGSVMVFSSPENFSGNLPSLVTFFYLRVSLLCAKYFFYIRIAPLVLQPKREGHSP